MPRNELGFDVTAFDNASRVFAKMAAQVDRLSARLDKLDRKQVDVDVDVDKSLGKVERLVDRAGAALENLVPKSKVHLAALSAAAVGAFATLPVIARVASVGIVGALGAGLAAVGLKAAATSKRVKAVFADLKKDVQARMRGLAAPLEGVLLNVARRARHAFGSIAPALGASFQRMAGPLRVFTNQAARAFTKLSAAIGPVTDAFTAILADLGPRLPRIVTKVSAALIILAGVARRNAGTLGKMIDVAASAFGTFAMLMSFADRVGRAITRAFSGAARAVGAAAKAIASAMLGMVSRVLGGLGRMFGVLARLPGPWGDAFAAASAAVANTKQKVDLLRGAIAATHGKRVDVVARTLGGDGLRAMRARIAAIQSKRVTLAVDIVTSGRVPTGGLIARQHGGPVMRSWPYIVGEKGPELFVPRTSGWIVSNRDAVTPIKAAGPGGGTGGVVVDIHDNTFTEPVDVDMLASRLAFQTRVASFG